MDLRLVLKSPFIYETYQLLVGGIYVREECVRLLGLKPGHRVLDVGCGPAYYLAKMPAVDYYGFDTDQTYIDHARRKFGTRGHFQCAMFTAEAAAKVGKVDRIMLMGLLHHLDDAKCHELLALLASVLAPGGVILTNDTTVHEGQNRLERMLAEGDRGDFVREPQRFEEIARDHFEEVEGHIPERFLLPSVFWLMRLSRPRVPAGD